MKERNMKLSFIFALLAIVLCFSVCFADVVDVDDDVLADDSQEELVVDYGDYDDYDDSSSGLSDDEMASYYEDYRNYLTDYYASYEREAPVRAVVVSIGEINEKYDISYDYSISKNIIQDVKVRIDEGDHKGSEINLEYLLSADPLNNIVLAKLHPGDKIYVSITEAADGTITGEISNSWSTVQRINLVLCLAIIATLLMIIFFSKDGINTALITAIVIIGATIIIPSFAFAGLGTLWTSLLLAILLIVAISIAHLKFTKDTVKAMCISGALTLASLLVVLAVNHITRTVGTVFEYAAIAENIILGNISFTELFYMGTLFITSGLVANTVAICINKINKHGVKTYESKVALCSETIMSNVINVTLILLVAYIPNHILLISNKFSNVEIVNSETLISEIVRILGIIVPIIFVGPIVSLDSLNIGRIDAPAPQKQIEEPKAKEEPVVEKVEEKVEEEPENKPEEKVEEKKEKTEKSKKAGKNK
jgi:uncharacterized membrane protein